MIVIVGGLPGVPTLTEEAMSRTYKDDPKFKKLKSLSLKKKRKLLEEAKREVDEREMRWKG